MQAMSDHVLVGGDHDGQRLRIADGAPSIRIPVQTESVSMSPNFYPTAQTTAPKPKVAEYTRRKIHKGGEFFAAVELGDREAVALLIDGYRPH